MSTATAEPETQTKVTFLSRSPNQVLTRRATRYLTTATGQRVEQTQQDWVRDQREKNDERELRDGLEPKPIDEAPWKVEFQGSRFDTDDPIIIDFLRSHWLFQHPKGFWEQGAAPDEPRPTAAEQTVRVGEAGAERDIPQLEAIIMGEKETHNRPAVIMGAEAAIATVEGLRAEIGSESENDGGADDDPGSGAAA